MVGQPLLVLTWLSCQRPPIACKAKLNKLYSGRMSQGSLILLSEARQKGIKD